MTVVAIVFALLFVVPPVVFTFLKKRKELESRHLELQMATNGSFMFISRTKNPTVVVLQSSKCRSTYISLDIRRHFEEAKHIVHNHTRHFKATNDQCKTREETTQA